LKIFKNGWEIEKKDEVVGQHFLVSMVKYLKRLQDPAAFF